MEYGNSGPRVTEKTTMSKMSAIFLVGGGKITSDFTIILLLAAMGGVEHVQHAYVQTDLALYPPLLYVLHHRSNINLYHITTHVTM